MIITLAELTQIEAIAESMSEETHRSHLRPVTKTAKRGLRNFQHSQSFEEHALERKNGKPRNFFLFGAKEFAKVGITNGDEDDADADDELADDDYYNETSEDEPTQEGADHH